MTGEHGIVSVICCFTSEEALAYLADSLDEQTLPCERIFVDNQENRFTSAAAALNYGATKATGDLMLFCHQDIRFKDSHALEDLVTSCDELQIGDVGGVAGAIRAGHRKVTKTNITHSPQEVRYDRRDWFYTSYIEVESVDECVIALRRETWEVAPFDERLCDGWHLYAVERCLLARATGCRALAFDARINHLSVSGTMDKAFFACLRKLVAVYGAAFDAIVATTGYWSCRFLGVSIARHKANKLLEPLCQRRPAVS